MTTPTFRPGNRVKATHPNPLLPSYTDLLNAEGVVIRVEEFAGDIILHVRFDVSNMTIAMHSDELTKLGPVLA